MAEIKVSTGGFTPELWSDKININLDSYGAYNDIVNRKYEGEIKKKGDKVYFYTYGDLTVKDYDPTNSSFTGLEYEDPQVNQQKYIGFLVDDIQEVQSNVELVNGYKNRMSVAFANTKDAYIHSLATAGAGTKLHDTSAITLTKDNVWAEVCTLEEKLAEKNAITKNGLDYNGKRPALVVTPKFRSILEQSSNFFANAFGEKVLRTGQIGRIGAFDVFLSTNIKTVTSGGSTKSQTIVAITSDAIMFADQITKTETLRDVKQIGDYVRSLMVYGGVVANPNCIVTSKFAVTE